MSIENVESCRNNFSRTLPIDNALLSLDETAACFKMSRRTFYRKRPQLVASGLRQVRDHTRFKYPASSVRQFIDAAAKSGNLISSKKS